MQLRQTRLIVAAVAASALGALAPSSAQADDRAAARPLFDEGRRLMKEGKVAAACAKFEAASHLTTTTGVRLNLAACWASLGRTASAWATYDDARTIATRNGESAAADLAQKGMSDLEPKLSRLVVSVTDRSAVGLEVTRDGEPLLPAAWGVGVPVDPGVHDIAARATDRKPWSARVNVAAEGKSVGVTVPALEPQAVIATAPTTKPTTGTGGPQDGAAPARERSSAWLTAGWVAGGVGVVGLGVGAAFGFKAISDKSAAHCDSSGACDAGPLGNANTSATISTVGFIAGGALVAGGIALVLLAPRREVATPAVATLKLSPLVGMRDAGLSLGGTW